MNGHVSGTGVFFHSITVYILHEQYTQRGQEKFDETSHRTSFNLVPVHVDFLGKIGRSYKWAW